MFNLSENIRGKQCFIVGRLYLFEVSFGHLLFAKAGGVNEIMFLKVLLFKEILMDTMCTTTHILKCLQFPLVKGEQHEGWNWEALSSRVKEEQDCRGNRAQQADQNRTPESKGI